MTDDERREREELEKTLAREHHYLFAHALLPKMVFGGVPERLLPMIVGSDFGLFAFGVWNEVAKRLPPEKRIALNEPMRSESRELEGYATAIVTLPAAERVTEAICVAVAIKPGRKKLLGGTTPATVRYLTLELSEDPIRKAACTVVCEWRKDGSHVNHGEGPDPNAEIVTAFATRIGSILRG